MAMDGLRRSVFHVAKMDCAGEERLVRMALEGVPGVRALSFDLPQRRLMIEHEGDPATMLEALAPLRLGAHLLESGAVDGAAAPTGGMAEDTAGEARVLRLLLAINAVMFALELGVGWYAQSTGLIADSLDMFADAAVYGIALYAVGRAATIKLRAARLSGVLQVLLALGVLAEVVRRALYGSEPLSAVMMGMGVVALAANVTCLALLAKQRDGGAHMKASWIFSTNDVLANLGVIVAGLLVAATASPWPDLVIGTAIGSLVLSGGIRILRLRG
jgi:Co/Zn/Cd efflux system component